jgi:hypothetical protein
MFIKDVHAAIYMNASLIPPSLESEEGASERCTENSDELLEIVVITVWAGVSTLGFERANNLDCRRASRRKRFIVRADEKLNCVVESESAIRACGELS